MSKNFRRGDRVIARNDFLGYYYPGKLTKIVDTKHADVAFETGYKQKNLVFKYIHKLFDVHAYFTLGDYVLASVINEYDQLCWVPGIIQAIDDYSYPKLYTVLYFNGQENENIKLEMVKINKSSYGKIVENIRLRLGLNTRCKNSIELRPSHEIVQTTSPEPPRADTPPDLGEIKRDIVDQIKQHLDSLRLDDKYQTINDEFTNFKETHQELKSCLSGKLHNLRQDFDEWKNQEPTIIKINPNKVVNQSSSKTKLHPSMNLEKKLIKLRMELPHLTDGEPVLAKWPEKGWYYHCMIIRYLGDFKYKITGADRETAEIYREDLIPINLNDIHSFNIGDPVVALHPHYEQSYAPGQIVSIQNSKSKVMVRFYDYTESLITSEEVFRLHILKFQNDIDFINYLESKWIGQFVLARNNENNAYEIGKITGRIGNTGRQFIIEWKNGEESLQNFNHIFGGAAKNPSLVANECVFATRTNEDVFFPGKIIGRRGENLIIKFYDDRIEESVNENNCYWITKSYYKEACNFYRTNNDPINLKGRSMSRNQQGTPVIDAKQFYSGKKSHK